MFQFGLKDYPIKALKMAKIQAINPNVVLHHTLVFTLVCTQEPITGLWAPDAQYAVEE